MGSHGLSYCDSGYEQLLDVCECGNEHSGSIKCEEFLRIYQRLRKDYAPCSNNLVS